MNGCESRQTCITTTFGWPNTQFLFLSSLETPRIAFHVALGLSALFVGRMTCFFEVG